MKKFKKWRRKRLFIKAYTILRHESEFHKEAGHLTEFEAVGTNLVLLRCTGCPNPYPTKRKSR